MGQYRPRVLSSGSPQEKQGAEIPWQIRGHGLTLGLTAHAAKIIKIHKTDEHKDNPRYLVYVDGSN